jgi:hypothetical protein
MSYEKPVDPSKNALKHGCCANDTLLLPTESVEDLKALEVTWLKAYNPTTEAERHLVQELAHADWFLQRATRKYADVEAGLYTATPNPVDWTDQQERKLGRFLRYKTAHTNNVLKCRKAVEDFRKARLSENAGEAKATLARERFEFQKKKAKPSEPNWKEHLANMRQQAIDLGFVPPEPPNPMKR